MTAYKAVKPQAGVAAPLAHDGLAGASLLADVTNGTVNNGRKMDVRPMLLTPLAVTKDNVVASAL
jgi:ABC-type xylose transport system substrate-binding protein